jgi:flavoprotein
MFFVVGEMEYVFHAYETQTNDDKGNQVWNVAFRAQKGNRTSHGITGSGNASQVMAAVIQCIKKWIELYPKVVTFFFSAKLDEPSRVKLYSRMAQSIKVPGWKMYKETFKTKELYYFTKG